ncbi:MAG: hypothetical protein IT347_04660 [Candidatus Eisenbacteria bacterium]|nr:hypothetical protein [Candidatus Eisenbacteria bacterium]
MATEHTAQAESRRPGVVVLLIVLLAGIAALHAADLRQPFMTDDYLFLEQARAGSLWEALTSADPLGNYFRPVGRQVFFALVGGLGGEQPWVYRLVNLGLFLAATVLLFRIARRLLGGRAALVAAAFFGLHYAAAVPLLWISGSQDILASFFGLLCIETALGGHRTASAAALALALLSKESAVAAPVAVVALLWARGADLRGALRASAALGGVLVLWLALWLATSGARPARPDLPTGVAAAPLAAFVHGLQVALGLEFRAGQPVLGHWSASAQWLAISAGLLIWLAGGARAGAPDAALPAGARGRVAFAGLAWAAAGAAPVVAVSSIWSAYFYLFALGGAALSLAALLATAPRTVVAATIALTTLLSVQATRLDEFAGRPDPWAWRSHVTDHSVRRAMGLSSKFLAELKSARPTLPRRSTVFFADVPPAAGWQAGSGALLRWAYRDTSLRSHFLGEFGAGLAARGPIYFFSVENGALVDHSDDPMMLPSFAYSMLLADRPQAASDALDLALTKDPSARDLRRWRGWAKLAQGDTLAAYSDLRAAGITPVFSAALDSTAGGVKAVPDTAARIASLEAAVRLAGLSPNLHARLAALYLASPERRTQGAIEAYAYRVLRPRAPDAWRKWAAAQLAERQYEAALRSLERYRALLAGEGRDDTEAAAVVASLRRLSSGSIGGHAAMPEAPR